MQPEVRSHNQVGRAILTRQRKDVNAFITEWNAAQKAKWMSNIDAPIQILAEAYQEEVERLLQGGAASQEWIDVLQSAKLLRAATVDRLPKSKLTSLPLSEPKNIADRTYGFLVDAMYRFDSSLGGFQVKRFKS